MAKKKKKKKSTFVAQVTLNCKIEVQIARLNLGVLLFTG